MTPGTRKISLGVALIAIACVAVLLLKPSARAPQAPVSLTFVRYDNAANSAVVQVSNRSSFKVQYSYMSAALRWPDPDEDTLAPNQVKEITLPVSPLRGTASPTSGVEVLVERAESGLRSRIARLIARTGIFEQPGPEQWEVSLELSPPKLSSP